MKLSDMMQEAEVALKQMESKAERAVERRRGRPRRQRRRRRRRGGCGGGGGGDTWTEDGRGQSPASKALDSYGRRRDECWSCDGRFGEGGGDETANGDGIATAACPELAESEDTITMLMEQVAHEQQEKRKPVERMFSERLDCGRAFYVDTDEDAVAAKAVGIKGHTGLDHGAFGCWMLSGRQERCIAPADLPPLKRPASSGQLRAVPASLEGQPASSRLCGV